jgi:catechol 2,3-dioxygenase-like lactoylglutathione lyase family enzyme
MNMNIHMNSPATPATRAYVEHVAIRVHDIHWHMRFFREVLGMGMRDLHGTSEQPSQYWSVGGLQLIASPGFQAPPCNDAGWLAHLGIMVEDVDAAVWAAMQWEGVKALPQGSNWLRLPDGLAIELLQAAPGSVAQALAVQPRA